MLGYIVQRILAAIPVMGFVALFVFLLLRLTPGDPAAIIAGDTATPAQLAAIRERLGLTDPIHIQFFNWISDLLRGDFGVSIISGQPVITMIAGRLEPTISLALTTITLSIIIAVPLGVIAAWKQGTIIDRLVMAISVVGFSVPIFVIGYVMIQIFSMQLGWLPVQGFRSITEGVGPVRAAHLVADAFADAALYRTDRANHPHLHAGNPERGLRAHGPCQGAHRKPRSDASMRFRKIAPCPGSSPSSVSASR